MATKSMVSEFALARRLCYLRVNLDTILNNTRKLKAKCAAHTEVMSVLKGNAYGHGAVPVARHLEKNGFTYFAVATSLEGEELRQGGVKGFIQILGNAAPDEIPNYYKNSLVPTVATMEFLSAWVRYWTSHADKDKKNPGPEIGQVVIKVDTGLSRNGCQPEVLPELYQFCKNNGIPVHSIMTQFAQAMDDHTFTKKQYDMYLKLVEPYRKADGIKLHVSNTPALFHGIGNELDYIRMGISLFGQPPGTSDLAVKFTKECGLEPSLVWMAKPTLVKVLEPGRVVGYDKTYECKETETIATLPVGYADGYNRLLTGKGIVSSKEGVECPVVGRVSMDAITIKIPEEAKGCEEFQAITDTFNDINSVVAISRLTNTLPMEVLGRLDSRIPRLFIVDGEIKTADCI